LYVADQTSRHTSEQPRITGLRVTAYIGVPGPPLHP